MAGERALFGARDVSPVGNVTPGASGRKYMGTEKRRHHRRSNEDRRTEIRFDLKGDRRQNRGRREGDLAANFW